MSRCFPYPPPGCSLNRASEEGLIESIKLQKEKRKSKERKKGNDKRKEKKEKRKEKKEVKNHANGKKDQITEKCDIPEVQIGKNICAKSELLERSGLTEEHEQPYAPSTSYDSTENTNKRKRQFSIVLGNRDHATMIKIRLPSKTINVSDASINEQVCSTSGRTDVATQDKVEFGLKNKQEGPCSQFGKTSDFSQSFTPSTDKEPICLTSQKVDDVVPATIGTPSAQHKASKQSKEYLQYKDLLENCMPALPKDTLFDQEDLSWLFCSKKQCELSEKRLKTDDDILTCTSNSSLWQPRAQYLPQASLFALPYTIPF